MKNDGVTITLLAAGALAAGAAMVRLGSGAQKQEKPRSLVMKRILAFKDKDRDTILRTLESMGLGVVTLSQYYNDINFGVSGWTKGQLAEWASEVEHDDVIRMLPWLKVVMERGELRSFSTGLGLNPVDDGEDITIGPRIYPTHVNRVGSTFMLHNKRDMYNCTTADGRYILVGGEHAVVVVSFDEWEKKHGSIGIIPFLQEVTDWAVATRPKALFSMTYRQAAEAAYQWHQDLRTRKRKELSDVGMHVVWRWSDGWFVTKIDSAQAVDAQGEQMDHCIADVFKSKILSKKTNAFSVRDPDCRPVVTIEVAKDGTVRQARGRGNSDPKPIYASYTLDFLGKSGLADLTKASSDLALIRKNASPIRSTGRQADETVTCPVRMEDLAKTQRVLQAFPYSPSALQALDTTLRAEEQRQRRKQREQEERVKERAERQEIERKERAELQEIDRKKQAERKEVERKERAERQKVERQTRMLLVRPEKEDWDPYYYHEYYAGSEFDTILDGPVSLILYERRERWVEVGKTYAGLLLTRPDGTRILQADGKMPNHLAVTTSLPDRPPK